MKHCPNCGAKDFSSDHRGSYSKEHCESCKGKGKTAPKMSPKKMPMQPMKKNPLFGA